MIVHQFRLWAQTASPSGRADGASALARAYLYSDLGERERAEALTVLTAFLDDPSPLVRRALAEAFASAADAPPHILLALADDQPSIASIVLARSPILEDATLIDCIAAADSLAQAAIAARPVLSPLVILTLAEIAAAEALVVLARNTALALPASALARMAERHGDVAELRSALLARTDLPTPVRIDLVAATARALGAFVTERNWLSGERMGRVAREAKDKAAIVIAGSAAGRSGAQELASHLRKAGQLSVGFAFRTILSGKLELFRAILAELADVPLARVDGLAAQPESAGFAALYRKAGLPQELLAAFRIALAATAETDWTLARGAGLSRRAIEHVLTACTTINGGDLDKLLVLLRRFESEAARDEARSLPQAVPVAPLALSERPRTPLLLRDLDAPPSRETTPRLPSRRGLGAPAIDLAAIEAELRAA